MNNAASGMHNEPSTPMQLVEVYSVTDPNVAEIIKAALQREGITCWIEGENQAGLAGVLSITLLTRAKDADHAHRIIASFDH
ncbi:MAG: DUF2007 domain-containing protein [Rhodopirellula sp.]|nr:DUF2007 domain-containing protein [Rhodopirellula sp.]